MIKQKSKPGTKVTEDKATPQKQRIRELIKKPKEKFLTKSQEEYWKVLGENQITICIGPSGTGKSYVTLKKAIDLLWEEDNRYEKIVLARPPVVAGTEIGHLPGDLNAKLDPYIIPSYYLLNKIIGKEELEKLKDLGIVEILSISHLRGYNIDNAIKRNRMKRIVKENYRNLEQHVKDYNDIVFVVRKSNLLPVFNEIKKEMKYLFKKLDLLL